MIEKRTETRAKDGKRSRDTRRHEGRGKGTGEGEVGFRAIAHLTEPEYFGTLGQVREKVKLGFRKNFEKRKREDACGRRAGVVP